MPVVRLVGWVFAGGESHGEGSLEPVSPQTRYTRTVRVTGTKAATYLLEQGAVFGPGRRYAGADPAQVARAPAEVAQSFRNFQVVAEREAEQRAELAAVPAEVVAAVPYFEEDITDLEGLARLGHRIWE